VKISWVKAVLFFCISTFLLFGCREEKITKDHAEKEVKTAVEEVPEGAVALVGGEAIPEADLEVTLEELPERRRESLRMRTIYYLVDTKIFSEEAKKMGFDKDPELQKKMESTERDILSRLFISKRIEPEIEPSEEEIKEYFDKQEGRLEVPEGIKVSRVRAVKREDAEAAVEALKKGVPFLEVVRQRSKLVHRKKRGAQEWLYRGRIDPALEKAAFAVEEGKTSGVIKTGNEFQVVKVLERSEGRPVKLKDVESKIRFRLMQEKKMRMMHDCYEKADVVKNPGKGILVKVGDEVFKEEAIADILAKTPEKNKEELRQRWIQYFVDSTVFSKEAIKAGLRDDPKIVRKIRLKRADVLADAYRERVVEKKIRVTDEDIAEEYKTNIDAFKKEPFSMKVGLIVVETREKAEEILKKVEKGMAFSLLARQKSIHPSSKTGGGIDWFGKGEHPVIEAAAMKLKKYEVSDIIEMDKGFGLVKLIGTRGGAKSIEEVKPLIKMILSRKRNGEELKRYYDKWDVKILEKAPEVEEPKHPEKVVQPEAVE